MSHEAHPSVSVVIPCFNGEAFVADAVRSVLSQTSLPLEIVVVDDGSTDRSAECVRALASPLVTLLQQDNAGESAARNLGIEHTRGTWIAFLDADDIWAPNKLERQLSELHQRDAERLVCIHTGYYTFGDVDSVPVIPETLLRDDYGLADHICTPYIRTSSVVMRAATGVRFPEWTRRGEDTIFLAELSLHGAFRYIPEPLVGYRVSRFQQTREMDHLTSYHASLLRWLELHAERIGPAQKIDIERRLVADLIHRLDAFKWRREWPRYWSLREYLTSLKNDGPAHPLLQERIYPPLLYRVKDWVDRRLKDAHDRP